MSLFTHNLNDLLYLSSTKQPLVKHLKKNYKENIHFIIKKNIIYKSNSGGQNEIIFLLTEITYELLSNYEFDINKYTMFEKYIFTHKNYLNISIK